MTKQIEIQRPDAWRISMSGMSIKTGWGDDKRIVVAAPPGSAGNRELYEAWLADAESIVSAHNATLPNKEQQ